MSLNAAGWKALADEAISGFQLLLSLKDTVIGLVDAVEPLFPQAGAGPQKLDAVKTMLTTAFASAGNVSNVIEGAWPTISNFIGIVVAARKVPTPAAPPAAA